MTIIYFLLPISLAFVGFFTWAFIKAVKSGQYDDLESPAARALLDDNYKIDKRESSS